MASNTEEILCWQCSEYVDIFPDFMLCIRNLKKKRKKTDEDNIVEEFISNGSSEITDKAMINSIFDYAAIILYICKSTYKDHYTFKINTEIKGRNVCKSCGENIISFDCNTYNLDPEIKYVDVETFEQLAHEISEIKEYLSDINKNKYPLKNYNEDTKLHDKNIQLEYTKLFEECENKDKVINMLTERLTTVINDNARETVKLKETINELNMDINNGWQRINKSHRIRVHKNNWEIPLQNRFSKMPIDNCIMNDDNCYDTYMPINHRTNVSSHNSDKSRIYVHKNPEKNVLPLRNIRKPVVHIFPDN